MYETESNPIQPSSFGKGVALAGYWSAGATWLLALIVLLLLFGAFWWMMSYNARAMRVEQQRAEQERIEEQRAPLTSFG